MFDTSKLLKIIDITKRIGNFFKLPIQFFGRLPYPELALKGMKLGETTIRFYTPSGLESQSRVEVVIPSLKNVSINKTEKKIKVGDEVHLTYSFYPTRSEPTFTWSSSDNGVIDVSKDGLVKAISVGKAKITITSDTGVHDSIEFKVKKK